MTDIFGDSNLEDLAHLYSKRIHPEDEATVEKITTPKNWDFTNFKCTRNYSHREPKKIY